jgi:hypothetical protein
VLVLTSNFNLEDWNSTTLDKYGCLPWNIQTLWKIQHYTLKCLCCKVPYEYFVLYMMKEYPRTDGYYYVYLIDWLIVVEHPWVSCFSWDILSSYIGQSIHRVLYNTSILKDLYANIILDRYRVKIKGNS